MKKILSMLAFACLPLVASAQYFELTPQGFVNPSEHSKKYVVIDLPGNTQKQLFDRVSTYLQTTKGFDIVQTPPDRIAVTGTQDNIEALAGLFKRPYTVQYTIALRFKDDRLRIDGPVIDDMTSMDNFTKLYPTAPQPGVDGYFIYDKNGKVKNEPGKANLEALFNTFVNNLIASFKADDGQDDDDW